MIMEKECSTGLAFALPSREYDTPSHMLLRDCLGNSLNIENSDCVDYTLEEWAKQDVLLLNASLTIPKKGNPRQHLHKWELFIKNVIDTLCKHKQNTIFCFLGKDANRFSKYVKVNNYVIKTCHPAATLKAESEMLKIPDDLNFRKSKLFSRIDKILFNMDKQIIWI